MREVVFGQPRDHSLVLHVRAGGHVHDQVTVLLPMPVIPKRSTVIPYLLLLWLTVKGLTNEARSMPPKAGWIQITKVVSKQE